MDIDIWVKPSSGNAAATMKALRRFGAALNSLSVGDLRKDDTIFQIGVAPRRIDILTGVSGLQFEETFARSAQVEIEGIQVHIPSVDDLIRNKRASGRTRDLADAEALESLNTSARGKLGVRPKLRR